MQMVSVACHNTLIPPTTWNNCTPSVSPHQERLITTIVPFSHAWLWGGATLVCLSVGPPLSFRLKFLNNYLMDRHGILYKLSPEDFSSDDKLTALAFSEMSQDESECHQSYYNST